MRRALVLAALAIGLLAGSCGSQSDGTPVACLEGSGAYLRALGAAPGEVRLDEGTAISDCLAANQNGGDLATVGTATVAAATKLNAEARAAPGGNANVALGYLLGAATHGAEDTEGIHAELLRRLTAAARYSPDNRPLPAAFAKAYRRGYDAGRENG
ncbi:MAG TPA: hypothetical protein VHQ43_11070 [Solirubrobacterales bacterium]|nr:hypothetical protein [Solirubrobacterales bacterium]